ncbi:TatD family hydrolase [Oscillospiraceae bacterium PP1C4]
MYQNIFDTHAHYDDEKFAEDRHEVLSSLKGKGVCAVLNAACDMESAAASIKLTEQYDFVYCAVGVHPHSASEFTPADLDTLTAYTKLPKVVAIGEIGLDYHYDFSPREMQQQVFEAQIKLALDLDLPIIVHDREAHADTMALLQKYKPRGIVHCYSGSAEMAKEILKIGMYIAFGGAVTFKNARKTLEAAAAVPLERLLVETDCPYMTPEPFRGRRCDSSHIAYTAQTLAEIKNVTPQTLLDYTCKNAYDVYRIER